MQSVVCCVDHHHLTHHHRHHAGLVWQEASEEYKRGDTLLQLERKTEFIATLVDAALALGHDIKLAFDDHIRARLYTTDLDVIVEENPGLEARAEQVEQVSKTTLKVSVGSELGSRAPVGKH